ncbi:MAG: dihydropteroate synthase, partial [Candidatus Afipia apatlaquensis]|nr:dihydropteroate synthase [Candidatus Afipia apatlaquensis]
MGIRDYLEKGILVFDGAMGTMLQKMGLKVGDLPETLNIKEREKIIQIHKKYIAAGAKVIITNTFGASEVKLKNSGFSVEQIIDEGIKIAKEAARNSETFIALDIGPIGEMLEPMGTMKFEEAYQIFKRQIIQGVKSEADLILIETMTDLYEAKAAVLAAKENSELPVFCTMSFEKDKRTFTGCSAVSMVMVLQGLGVDALGINCSLGPREIEPILDEILKISKVPVMVQPNAGLPCLCHGETTFDVSPEEFAFFGRKFVEKGVKVIGGCCGTTDEYIKLLVKSIENVKIEHKAHESISGICTPSKALIIDETKVIGERINPTGNKLIKEALKNRGIDYILREAISQVEAGADILDINVGLPEIDEVELMVKVIKEIQSILDVPIQIDSSDPKVIEKALRIFRGKALVNSVNGEEKVLESILPIVKKYGAAVVGLTLDNKGVPVNAEKRYEIAEKIVKSAEEYGIDRDDIYIDCLTLTSAAQQEDVKETVRALSMVKERLKVKTVLGVSNVSFGLPNREILNRTFLAAALGTGLDLPIIDPKDKGMMDTIKAFKVLWNQDKGAADFVSYYKDSTKKVINVKDVKGEDLLGIIIEGRKEEGKNVTSKMLQNNNPMKIVNEYIIPALDLVGEKYGSGEIFLPQLIQSAETVKSCFEVIKENFKGDSSSQISKGKIIMATVKGDIHDLGKNIVKLLLENYGFEVHDLGKDVDKEKIIDEVQKYNIKLIGLSALMTTTVKSMEETIKALKNVCP